MDRYEWLAIGILSLFAIPVGWLVFIFVVAPICHARAEKRMRRRTVNDTEFGEMTWCEGSWTLFPNGAAGFPVYVDGPETGLSESQRACIRNLIRELPPRAAEARAFIAESPQPPPCAAELDVYAVDAGAAGEGDRGNFVIELSDGAAHEIHRVVFREGKPAEYGVDD